MQVREPAGYLLDGRTGSCFIGHRFASLPLSVDQIKSQMLLHQSEMLVFRVESEIVRQDTVHQHQVRNATLLIPLLRFRI